MSCSTASIWSKIALGCLSFGTLMFTIGFATNAWVINRMITTRYGLWTYYLCGLKFCGTFDVDTLFLEVHQWTVWFRATQVIECFGFICDAFTFLLLILYICFERLRRRVVLVLTIISCFVAVLSMMIGFAIFGAELTKHVGMELGWSFFVAIVGSIFIFAAGLVTVVELRT